MSLSSPEAEGGGEEQLLPQLSELEVPTVSESGMAYTELSVALGLTYDDYMKEPETSLSNLVGSDIGLSQLGFEDGFTRWRATHMYGGKLVVQELYNGKHVGRWMVAGSVYTPTSVAETLTSEENGHLAMAVWHHQSMTGITTKEREIPAMIAPGILCINGMLSIKRLRTANELRSRESVAELLIKPQACYAVALSNGADQQPTVYFLEDQAHLTMPITAAGRIVQDGFYQLLP